MNAAYVILAAPLLGALLLLVGHRRLLEPLAGWIVVVLGFVSFGASIWLWVSLLGRSAAHRSVQLQIFQWIPVDRLRVDFGLQVDPLSVFFCLFVTGVSSLIFLYSIGYMHGDPSFPRFFFYLSLFLFSMVSLVLANNFLFSFLGWEGVGYCSYGLVGFWFERNKAAVAAKKAFVTNRVGDFGFMIALFLMYEHFGSFNFTRVLAPLAHGGTLSAGFATGLGLMILLGACGKSAQFPLYMWLPDAMEGPTPISALIHAATMVTAGVYLLARSAPILHFSPTTMWIVACVGITTAFIASTIACVETDIKRILAYSTLAEIGFMFLAEGSGDFSSALFLTITHAFFKALLFLSAGAVIHAMADEQDIWRMGGLRKYLPITFGAFFIGYLALSAIPPFSGWWAHEAVLEAAYHKDVALWVVGVVVDGLTAYYMSREVMLVFFGRARWKENRPNPAASATATPATPQGYPPEAAHGAAGEHAHGEPHDSPWTMSLPLILLAIAAVVGGVIDLPFGGADFLTRFLAPVFPTSVVPAYPLATGTRVAIGVAGTCVNFIGLILGVLAWRPGLPRPSLEPGFFRHGWYIDEGVAGAVAGPLALAADSVAYDVDRSGVDGFVGGVAALTAATGRQLRRIQTGYVRTYALGIGLGTAAILIYAAVRVGS
ncbi:NADH-quinone oxidoreductase subunit L [Acidimicrobiaceae bacterium USS-CC1]|uniref:NADH-quinone oxidoreductase subunit L n=1 Tax=Acidiferrimicrobium australe TaxID=2664430 RepID=A0ABW9QP71_9ACTN|nr:NADH-quinone oxidoreductase subunit L [Acidiferrimicrobium australe]